MKIEIWTKQKRKRLAEEKQIEFKHRLAAMKPDHLCVGTFAAGAVLACQYAQAIVAIYARPLIEIEAFGYLIKYTRRNGFDCRKLGRTITITIEQQPVDEARLKQLLREVTKNQNITIH